MGILDSLGRGNEGLPERFGLLNQYFGAISDILSCGIPNPARYRAVTRKKSAVSRIDNDFQEATSVANSSAPVPALR
jgi:hypothetical protein